MITLNNFIALQVGVSFSNGVEELNGSFNLQIFSNKHFIKISARKDRPYAKVVTSSPLMPWITLDIEGDLKKEDKKYNLVRNIRRQPLLFADFLYANLLIYKGKNGPKMTIIKSKKGLFYMRIEDLWSKMTEHIYRK